MTCFFCGGAAHPATGCQYSTTCLACGRCTREFWRWVKGWVKARTSKKRGPKPELSFYEAAVLFRRPVAGPLLGSPVETVHERQA